MNERIKQLAEQAFMVCLKGADEEHLEQLERFAELVRQDEREACAKLCDDASLYFIDQGMNAVDGADYCANEIRGRDMSTKPENIDTSAERVHETDKSIHEDDDIQEYKRPWVGLSDLEVGIYNHQFNCTRLARDIEALLRERNT
jgi:hypothetical protein